MTNIKIKFKLQINNHKGSYQVEQKIIKMVNFSKKLFILLIAITFAFCYLQFKLVRVPHHTKTYNYGIVQCLTDIPKKDKAKAKDEQQDHRRMLKQKKHEDEDEEDEEEKDKDEEEQDQSQMEEEQKKEVDNSNNFKQICYEKDIAYSIQLYNKNKELMLLSIDLTVPISWVKGEKCFITQTHHKCERIETNYRDQIQKISKKFQQLFKNPFRKKDKKPKKTASNEYALIQGSSEVVKGLLQKTQTLQFLTKDSGRLTRFTDLMLLGMFIIGIDAKLNLQNTTFINAIQISPALNFLCDGAISLRFDQNSQNSFLKEMANVAQSGEQNFVTIFIGEHNQSMTIGDLSVKNAAHGLSGVRWIVVEQDDDYGKLPRCQSIGLTQANSQIHKQVNIRLPIVLTLSSSSITIPKQYLQKIFQKFFPKKTCHIDQQTRFMICDKLSSSQLKQKQLNFITNETSIMVPFRDLIIEQKKHKVTFNIKSSLDQRFIILGEPVFRNYFVVLDYTNNRIGFALQRTKFADALFDAVSLIRFVVWAFIVGTCAICLLLPAQKFYTILINRLVTARVSKKKKFKKLSGGKDQNTKLTAYTQVQQENPYDDLKGKMSEIFHAEADGI